MTHGTQRINWTSKIYQLIGEPILCYLQHCSKNASHVSAGQA